jgi:hypothetical protein
MNGHDVNNAPCIQPSRWNLMVAVRKHPGIEMPGCFRCFCGTVLSFGVVRALRAAPKMPNCK